MVFAIKLENYILNMLQLNITMPLLIGSKVDFPISRDKFVMKLIKYIRLLPTKFKLV